MTNYLSADNAAARGEIQSLLNGNPPNSISVGDYGKWGYSVADLQKAFSQGGTPAVRKTFDAVVLAHPNLANLIAASEPQSPPEPQPVSSFIELPTSARLPKDLSLGACEWLNHFVAFNRKCSPRSFDGFHEAVAVWLLSVI